MKVIGFSAVVGVLLAMAIIWWLRPLNNGAIGVILLLSIAGASAVGHLLSRLLGSKTQTGTPGSKSQSDKK